MTNNRSFLLIGTLRSFAFPALSGNESGNSVVPVRCQCPACRRSSRLLQNSLAVEWPLNEMWRITKSCSCQRMSASTRPVTSDCTNRDHYSSPASQRTGRGCVNPFFCVVILVKNHPGTVLKSPNRTMLYPLYYQSKALWTLW